MPRGGDGEPAKTREAKVVTFDTAEGRDGRTGLRVGGDRERGVARRGPAAVAVRPARLAGREAVRLRQRGAAGGDRRRREVDLEHDGGAAAGMHREAKRGMVGFTPQRMDNTVKVLIGALV